MNAPKVVPVTMTFHRPRPPGTVVDGALVHAMAEYVVNEGHSEHAPAFLQRIGLSVHALIGPDGTIYTGPPPERVCFHAGKSRFLDRENLNDTFLGCEFLVAGTHDYPSFLATISDPDRSPYTAAQYETSGWLYAGWSLRCPGITRARIVGHEVVSGMDVRAHDAKRDPGMAFDWAAFWRAYDSWYGVMAMAKAPRHTEALQS